MQNTPYMGLVQWNQDSDDFSSAQLAENFQLIDQHNHTTGQGQQIPGAGIVSGSIVAANLANGAVGTAQLAANAVATDNIQNAAITATKLGPNSVTAGAIPEQSLGYGQLDPSVVPLGTVALWWRIPGSTAGPGGNWEIMDGRGWNLITNAWGLTSGVIPDMRGAFAMGADVNGVVAPGVGVTGGSNVISVAHSHNVNAHAHGIPDHAHTISVDGLHNHGFMDGLDLDLRANCFASGISIFDANGVRRNNTSNSLKVGSQTLSPGSNLDIPMDVDGSHSHSGSTGVASLSTANATATTDTQLGSVSIIPQFTALVYIMRVR